MKYLDDKTIGFLKEQVNQEFSKIYTVQEFSKEEMQEAKWNREWFNIQDVGRSKIISKWTFFTTTTIEQDESCDFPANQIQLFSKSDPIHQGLYRNAITSYTSQELNQYLKEKYKWKDHILDKIWWKIMEAVSKY